MHLIIQFSYTATGPQILKIVKKHTAGDTSTALIHNTVSNKLTDKYEWIGLIKNT